jgi:hypothetical protein
MRQFECADSKRRFHANSDARIDDSATRLR